MSEYESEYEQYYEYNENRRKRAILRKKMKQRRRKRIIKLIFSMIFVCFTFFTVLSAFVYNIQHTQKNAEQINDAESPMLKDASKKDGFMTVLVAITDEDQTRTDGLILATYDTKENIVNLLNIPRDTYTNATKTNKKITAAYINGIEHTKQMVCDLTGIMPDKYVVANFKGLENIIDMAGGIKVNVPFRMKYDDPVQNLHIDFKEGEQVLNGKQAVEFLRWRKNNNGIKPAGYANGDIGRIEKTQEFIQTAKDQFLSFSTIFKIPKITNEIFSSIDTDFKSSEVLWILTKFVNLNATNSYTLPGEDKYIKGVSYIKPNYDETLTLVNEQFNPYKNDIEKLNFYE